MADWQARLWCRVDAWVFGGPGCGMEVVFVRCRQLLKYIIYEIFHHKERSGRKASAVGSFA